MKSDTFSISGFFRWNRTDDEGISRACGEFAKEGTRFLSVDAETVKTFPERPQRMRQLCRIAAGSSLIFRDAHAVWGPGNDLNELTEDSRFAVHEAVIPILAENGIRTLTFHIGASCVYDTRDWAGNEEHYRAIAAHALERLLKSAEKYRITLAVENCFEPSTTAQEAMKLVKKFPSPYLGLCLDCGHANLMEPMDNRVVADMVGYIRKAWEPGIPRFTFAIAEFMAPEIVTVHIHDNDGLNDAFEVAILGTSTNSADSDGDGLGEWDEYHVYRTNPNNEDTDGDWLDDLIEIQEQTEPTKWDTDGDGAGDSVDPEPTFSNLWWVVSKTTNTWTGYGYAYVGDQSSWPTGPIWTNQLIVQGARPSTNAIPGRVTLWGLVDDAIMVDSNEVAWTNGAKVFSNLDVTTSITNLASDSFRIDLFDWPDLPNGGPNEVRLGREDNPFRVEWEWWKPFNIQMEPIWTSPNVSTLDNPSGIPVGSNAWFRIGVWPDDLFPATNIVWTSSFNKVDIPQPTGNRVQVNAIEEGIDELHVEVIGAYGNLGIPPFNIHVKPLTVVTAVVGVVELIDGTNLLVASSSERVTTVMEDANKILNQACMQIEWDGMIHSIPATLDDGYWNVVSGTAGITNLCSSLSSPGGLEIYFVNSISCRESPTAAGLHTTNGILIASNAHVRTLAHEIGHASGAADIYTERTDTYSTIQGPVQRAWVTNDWGIYRGVVSWNPSHSSIIARLLMFGLSSPSKGDIPTGNIHGFRYRYTAGSQEWFEDDSPCGLSAFTNTPASH